MDESEFEFPPDLLDSAEGIRLPTFPTSSPAITSEPPFAYTAESLPLSVLAQTPVDQLPPTRPRNPQNFSIGQVMRGALSPANMRQMPGGSGGLPRPTASVAPPLATSPYSHAAPSPYHSAGGTQPRGAFSDGEERGGGAEDTRAQHDGSNESGHDVSSSTNTTTDTAGEMTTPAPAPYASGRLAPLDWSEGEVRNFYQALSQFGTDFSAIAVLFARRSRSDIKRLYHREMRQKPKEVQQALNQKNPIDMKVFQERYEAKKKEEQLPVKTKELNMEELALMDEIENGMLATAAPAHSGNSSGEGEAVLPPAALEAGEEATAAPVLNKARKRKREAVVDPLTGEVQSTGDLAERAAPLWKQERGRQSEGETLFDLAMRHNREDNTPLERLYANHAAPAEDSDFTFE